MNGTRSITTVALDAVAIAIVPLGKPVKPLPPSPVSVVDAAGAPIPGAYLDNGVRVLVDGNVFGLDWQEGQALAVLDVTTVDDRVQIADRDNLYFKDPSCSEPISAYLDRYETFDDNIPIGAMVSIGPTTNGETGARAPLHRFSGPVDMVYVSIPTNNPPTCSEAGGWGPGRYMILEAWTGDLPSAPGPLHVELR